MSSGAKFVRLSAIVLLGLWNFAHPVTAQAQPQRGGFTILVDAGLGIQNDGYLEKSAVGLAGLNLGIGGFASEKLAVLFRFSGTNVNYDFGFLGDVNQVSGVAGPTIQYWPSDRFNLMGGMGMGFWNTGGVGERGFGVIVGGGLTIFNNGKHNFQLGVEFAPAFTDPGTMSNFGITLGYQFL